MAKRFTDTEKWDRPWYRKLPIAYRQLWDYICDKCDQIGVWYVDFELASFVIGFNFDSATALFHLEKQIEVLPGGQRWFVKSFVPFQYGVLSATNTFHQSMRRKIQSLGVSTPLLRGLIDPKDKEKEGVVFKENRGEEWRGGRRKPENHFSEFWAIYPKKKSKGDAYKAWRTLDPSEEQVSRILAAIDRAKISTDWRKEGGQYIPYPASWLRAQGWEDEIDTRRENGQSQTIHDRLLARELRAENGSNEMGQMSNLRK